MAEANCAACTVEDCLPGGACYRPETVSCDTSSVPGGQNICAAGTIVDGTPRGAAYWKLMQHQEYREIFLRRCNRAMGTAASNSE